MHLNSELGVHVDGYIATAAHTAVVSSNTQEPITGKAADVIAATHFAYETALRMLRPGIRVRLHENGILKLHGLIINI
jgi:methionine aminopeptidase